MIVLGKNKIDERYNILQDGTIVDTNGVEQKTYIGFGRPFFKKQKVHQIQMWTNYGWRDGKIWDIHHIDFNKQNNSLNNLVFLTRSQHAALHGRNLSGKNNPMYGKHHSDETKKKISNKIKGTKPSIETKKKLVEKKKGRIWVNNEKQEKCVEPNEIPNGFVKGRLKGIK